MEVNEHKIDINTAEAMFQKINRIHIKMRKKEKKENTTIVFSVLEKIITLLRASDKLFNSLNPKLDFLGSYFDGLRVGHPNEYDINVILKFPVDYKKIKLDSTHCFHDYTSVIMPSQFRRLLKTDEGSRTDFLKTQLWCNKGYKLSIFKFRAWMHSIVDHVLSKMPIEDGKRVIIINKKVKYRIFKNISGPAVTLTIMKEDDSIIDIDLVPTLKFKLPQKPVNSKVCFDKVEETKINTYFVVPKPNGDEFSWRLSFPFQERYHIKNKNNLKSALRIVKHFRDIQDFTKLCSYFIKVLFLWECANTDDMYWTNNSLSNLVFNMLYKLKHCLANRNIKNFWCPDHNIIEKIKPKTCECWHNRLSYILNDIKVKHHNDPFIIQKYFSKVQREHVNNKKK